MSQDDTSSITCIIQLHDFITNSKEHVDQFYHLDSMLKNRFRSSPNIPFSLRMNSLPFLTPTVSSNNDDDILDVWYDVVISYNFNSIIVSGTGNIQVFDYTTKKHLKRIEMKGIEIHELEIDKSGLNLYLSGVWINGIDLLQSGQQSSRVAKYDLRKLLFNDNDEGSEKSCLWISDDNSLTNLWGIGLFEFKNQTFVYAMDYSKGLTALDSKTGQKVNHIMPIIYCGYGVTFTPENEMIITSADYNGSPVSVYTFNQELKQWELRKNGPLTTGNNITYGLFYEISTQTIFVTDTVAHVVKGFDLQTLERVFHYQFTNENDQFYGILIDNRTGIMYIPEVNRKLLCFD